MCHADMLIIGGAQYWMILIITTLRLNTVGHVSCSIPGVVACLRMWICMDITLRIKKN